MAERMVFEKPTGWNLSDFDQNRVLRFVHESFVFMGDEEIRQDRDRFITVMAKADMPNSPSEPILQEDYLKNTLYPIAEKGRQLLDGCKPMLNRYHFDGYSLVFFFSPMPE